MFKNLFLCILARRRIGKIAGIGTDPGRGTLAGIVLSAGLFGVIIREYDGDTLCIPWSCVTKLIYGGKYEEGYKRFVAEQRELAEAEAAMRAETEPKPVMTEEELELHLQEKSKNLYSGVKEGEP